MGGRALFHQGLETLRLNKQAHDEVVSTLLPLFQQRFDVKGYAIPAYGQKPDFGDLDLLLPQEALWVPPEQRSASVGAWAEVIAFLSSHGVEHFAPNNEVLSFAWPVAQGHFQVDLIALPRVNLDYALCYYAFNDLGNLIGKVAHKMGLKHGFMGLTYPVREGTHMLAEVLVTRNHDEALAYLGFDVNQYHQGFETLYEIFQFVAKGERFHPDVYAFENMNHNARVRDKKRATYNGFMRFLEETKPSPGVRSVVEKSKDEYLAETRVRFPDFSKALDEVFAQREQKRQEKSLFNGHLVMAWTGLSGPELKVWMAQFKESVSADQWTTWLREKDGQAIENAVKNFLSAPAAKLSSYRP